jgi:hypothetical protein
VDLPFDADVSTGRFDDCRHPYGGPSWTQQAYGRNGIPPQ